MKTTIKGLLAGVLLLGAASISACDIDADGSCAADMVGKRAAAAGSCGGSPFAQIGLEGFAAGAAAYGYNYAVETDNSPAAKFRTGVVAAAALYLTRVTKCQSLSTLGALGVAAATIYGINYVKPYVAQAASSAMSSVTGTGTADSSSDAESKKRSAMMMAKAGK